MTILSDGRAIPVSGGEYYFSGEISTGSITISVSVEGGDFIAVTDGVLTATGTGVISLPLCNIKADYSDPANKLTIGKVS